MTLAGIEPATFQFVAQYLSVSHYNIYGNQAQLINYKTLVLNTISVCVYACLSHGIPAIQITPYASHYIITCGLSGSTVFSHIIL